MALFNNFPYSNTEEINLDYTLNKLNELYSRGENLYAELQAWKTKTDEADEAWKSDLLSDINEWQNSVTHSLEEWKTSVDSEVSNALTTLSNQITAELAQAKADLRNEVADLASAAAASAADAAASQSTAAQSAETAINSAAAAAQSEQNISESAEQIETNKDDIADLKSAVNQLKPQKTVTAEATSITITDINSVNDLKKIEIEIASETGVNNYLVNCYGINIFPSGKDTSKGYIANSYLASNGTTGTNNDWYITEYFEVKPLTKYRFLHFEYSNTFHLCFYNENYEYLSQQGYANTNYHDLTTAANVKYCRMSAKYNITSYSVRKKQDNNVAFPVSITSATFEAIEGILTNKVSGIVYNVTPPLLFVDNNYIQIQTSASTTSITATYYTNMDDIVTEVNKIPGIETDISNLKNQFFADSQYFRSVRWGASAFNSYYHSHDDGTSLFTSSTTAADYFTAFNTLVADYSGYADSHEMGVASDGATTMYYYTFNPKTNQDGTNYKRPKIIVGAGQHGFEKTANFGLYWFAKNLLEDWENNDFLAYVRNHVQLIIMPVLNPYGFDHDTYTNANGVNLNRNWETTNWSKGTQGTTTYGGEEPFDQVETQYARDVILANLDALWVCDYHNNGQVAPSTPAGYLWHSFALVTYDDAYFTKAIDAAKWHIDETTGHLYKDYPSICDYVNSGYFTDNNAPSHQGLMVAYAREHGIMAETMEGAAAFIDSGNRFSSPIHHMNADLIGNWIRCLLATYSKFVY